MAQGSTGASLCRVAGLTHRRVLKDQAAAIADIEIAAPVGLARADCGNAIVGLIVGGGGDAARLARRKNGRERATLVDRQAQGNAILVGNLEARHSGRRAARIVYTLFTSEPEILWVK